MKTNILVVVMCSVLSVNATFHSKQNEVEQKPDIFGSIMALKKNLFGGLKGGKGDDSFGGSHSSGSGSASLGGEANGYSYQPPVQPKPVYGPPPTVYRPQPVQPQPQPQIYRPQPVQPKPVYGPPHVQPAAPHGFAESGSSAASSSSSLGGHGGLGGGLGGGLQSISGLPVKLIGAKRAAINKILDKKLELLEKLSGGIGGKSHSSASASSSSLDF